MARCCRVMEPTWCSNRWIQSWRVLVDLAKLRTLALRRCPSSVVPRETSFMKNLTENWPMQPHTTRPQETARHMPLLAASIHDVDHELHVAAHDACVAVRLGLVSRLLSEDLVVAAAHGSPLLLLRRLHLAIG